ncbi:hypothetical protein AC482_03340 [miscellaneous Crenarchaeota group-15 archaeon DG-45]|uniref:Uncharacterized protein n=1 Tax=miscellaneous Crenarchaeota group-15 archaeon DG-45 TaxID=1685127 RepID=A0A0M0BQC0_9ARCH|nr:MAG: hypothetical protein AC482_03340 [miscellaneous Crenarchaeota group-15 archaeon DG-45]
MSHLELVRRIPRSMYGMLSEKLMDALLEAKGGDNVPSSLAKTILYYWQRDQLDSEAGVANLLHAAELADPARTGAVLDELGLEEIRLAMRLVEP